MDTESSFLNALQIKRLQPSSVIAEKDGVFSLKAPTSAIVGILDGKAVLSPGNVSLAKGDVLYVPPAVLCRLVWESTSPLVLAAVDFSFSYQGLDLTFALPKTPRLVYSKASEHILEDIGVICRSGGGKLDIQQTAESMAAGYRIAVCLCQEMKLIDNTVLEKHNDPAISKLLNYLETNYHLPLTVEDIAADCNVSRRQLFKVAGRIDKSTPIRLLKKIRLERSLDLLHQESIPVNQVAARVGYGSKSFSREFKRTYGMLPREFRQRALVGSHVAELMEKADANMREGHPRRASVLYCRAIESAHAWTNLDELYYKAGLAICELGDGDRAFEYWNNVTSLNYRLKVDLRNCERLSKSLDYVKIIGLLRGCYRLGDQEMRDIVANNLGDWMFQCAMDEKITAARKYCEFAKELINNHPSLERKLARSLFITGQFLEIEKYCGRIDFYVAAALRTAGFYDDHLKRFPHLREQCAVIHLRSGNFDTVLSDYTDIPKHCVSALVALGRPEEALEQFPRDAFLARIARHEYRQVLEEYAEDVEASAWALALLGYREEALTMASAVPDTRNNLQLYYERPHSILSDPTAHEKYRNAANVLHAIHLLESGMHEQALEVLGSIVPMTSEDYRFGHAFHHPDLFIPCIRHLYANIEPENSHSTWKPWRAHFNEIIRDYRYYYAQQHWYAMRLILDDIDEAAFLQQPHATVAKRELNLIKGLRADFLSQPGSAQESYTSYVDSAGDPTTPVLRGEWYLPVKLAFARWRLNELSINR